MGRPKKYPDELIQRAVRLALEGERPIAEIAHDLGMHPETLRRRVRQAEADGGNRPELLSSSEHEEIRGLRKENYELRRVNEILKSASLLPIGDPLTGHDGWVTAVTGGELDGRPVIVTGSGDATVRVWELADGSPIGEPLTGHDRMVSAVAVGELDDRPVIVSGGPDGTVRLWELGDRSCRSAIRLGSSIQGLAVVHPGRIVVGAAAGVMLLDLPDRARALDNACGNDDYGM
jgi:transposase-like protein